MLSAAFLLALTAAPSGGALVELKDPRYDDRGTGSYIYPTAGWYRPGQFDLRKFEVIPDRDWITLRVTMDAPFREPNRVQFNEYRAVNFDNGLYVQNIDIYIDHTPGKGETAGIPGRNIRFTSDQAWDHCIVLTPRPYVVRQSLNDWESQGEVWVADSVQSRGFEVWVRVPVSFLGGYPTDAWGYQVVVSGAMLQQNFDAFRRVAGSYLVNAYTLPVFGVAEVQAFGGGELSAVQPRAIDILVPPTRNQYAILKRWDEERRVHAAIPMIYAEADETTPPTASLDAPFRLEADALDRVAAPAATEPAPTEGATSSTTEASPPSRHRFIELRVLNVDDDLVVLERLDAVPNPYQIGDVLGGRDQMIGKLVVNAVFDTFIQATVVKGKGQIEPGHRVRFDLPQENEP
jgi:carbohydrate-binding DOMON domain-containing protein